MPCASILLAVALLCALQGLTHSGRPSRAAAARQKSEMRYVHLLCTRVAFRALYNRRVRRATRRIGSRNETIKEFVERLFSGYNGNIPPSTYDGTITKVQVGVYILDFGSLDLVNMDFSVTMFLRQIWHDPRLAYQDYDKPLALNYMRPRMWVPDLYFINEKQSRMHELTTPNLLMRLHPDGKIVYSQKVTVQLWCLMDLRKFPLDTQECEMKMESYGYTTEEVKLEWVNGTGNALQFSHRQLSEYELLAEHAGHCTEKYLTGAYSCLNVTFQMERKFGYYLIQTYIPTVLIVILSWVSFWIDVNAVPARISVGLLTVLSMTTQSSGMRAQLPRVSYVKAIDVWQSVSLVFVFGALIEFAIANFSQRLRDRKNNVKTTYDKDGTRRRCETLPPNVRANGKPKCRRPSRTVRHRPAPNFYRRPSLVFGLEHRRTRSSLYSCPEAACDDAETSFLWRRRPQPNGSCSTSRTPETAEKLGHWNACMTTFAVYDDVDLERQSNGGANSCHDVLLQPTDCKNECTTRINPPSKDPKVAASRNKSSTCNNMMEPDQIDHLARYLFPATFILFNLFYWLYYLHVK